MAVHLANILSTKLTTSALVCTRHSGILENDISEAVKFKCLHKKSALDIKAIKSLGKFIKAHHINIIHAHSTSFFIATLLKFRYPSLKIIWHDHYGFRYKTNKCQNLPLFICSFFFSQIVSVNEKLKVWADQNLCCKNVTYIQNFSLNSKVENAETSLKLSGNIKAFKVVHIANLRSVKDHITGLKAIKRLLDQNYLVSYHLFGGYDSNSDYYKNIIEFIDENNLRDYVFIYGSQSNISGLLNQADVGVLSSISEGLPVSLIEYAQSKLPIVVTDVGQCKEVVGEYAKVIKSKDENALAMALDDYINNPNEAKSNAEKLYGKISKEYDPESIIDKIINIYTSALK